MKNQNVKQITIAVVITAALFGVPALAITSRSANHSVPAPIAQTQKNAPTTKTRETKKQDPELSKDEELADGTDEELDVSESTRSASPSSSVLPMPSVPPS